MKWPGAFAIVAGFLFAVQFVWPFHHRLASLPINVGVVCLAVATIWGFVRGPAAVRWAIIQWLISLALFLLAVMIQPGMMSSGSTGGFPLPPMNRVLALVGAASLVFAIVVGIRALRAESTASRL
jgi:hypothetical protein